MAQVRAADRAGPGGFKFAFALAETSAGKLLVCLARTACRRGDWRGAATALVPGLVSALVATGILFQPVPRPRRAGDIFYFHPDAARLGAPADRQGFVATQTSARREDLLASGPRL